MDYSTNTVYQVNELEVFAEAIDPLFKERSEFKINRYQWLPLWVYIIGQDEESAENMHFTEEKAIALAKILREKLEEGHFASFCQLWNEDVDPRFVVTEEHLKDFIAFCGFSGGFNL